MTANRQAPSAMPGIGVDSGWAEEVAWIPAGCQYRSDHLSGNRIPHRLVSFDGGHTDRLAERFHDAMLPCVSETRDFGPWSARNPHGGSTHDEIVP